MAGPPALPPPDTAAAAAASSSASSPRYQEWILDTIDSLRSRKARPDLERICRMVRRRHGPEPERTRAELEKLIQQRAVLRVSYKGSISYRNAARVQPPRRGATPPPAPPSPLPLPLPPEGGASRSGPARPVSLREVVRYLGGSGSGGGRLTRGRVQGLLLEEEAAAARGRLERTRIAGLALPRNDRSGRAPPATSSRAARTKVRLGLEMKVLEEEEEEDEEEVSALSEGSEVPEGEGAHGGQNQYNGETGQREGGKDRPREWSSSIAPGRQDEGHRSALADGTREAFPMGVVKMEGGSASAATGPDSPSPVPLPPGKPALPSADGTPFGCSSGRKEKPSDPVEWTVMDVVEYFTEAGFPEQASAFQEQEIDGKSLLLMQRTDVLTGLSIRLGPALKIYEHHIKVLQQGHFEDDDPDGFLG
uniref:Sterile alpha motif domain containing 1 n=1 Tax=Vombatus ursinus TaxID=29139 RepID=A0A4X2M625_VOMUR